MLRNKHKENCKIICVDCGVKIMPEQTHCLLCDEWHRRVWEREHIEELKQIDRLQEFGHPHHCACRQVWGDGECECDLYEKGYDPYMWVKDVKKP